MPEVPQYIITGRLGLQRTFENEQHAIRFARALADFGEIPIIDYPDGTSYTLSSNPFPKKKT